MKTLIFDTCFDKSYIVLSDNDKILDYKIIESSENNYHSAFLIPEIKNLLVKNKLFIKDLYSIGINIGPGSFTGVRAGVTIARVLCQQFNIKLVGVSSLEILSQINNNSSTVILDARKNKVYFGEYENGIEVTSPCLKDKNELISYLNKKSMIITDNSIQEFLTENGIKSELYKNYEDKIGIYLHNLVQNKLKDFHNNYNWAEVKPLYIQKPSITKPKEKNDVL